MPNATPTTTDLHPTTRKQVEALPEDRRTRFFELLASTGCVDCASIAVLYGSHGPSHEGSRYCQSGSLKSGGRTAHCSCDTCF